MRITDSVVPDAVRPRPESAGEPMPPVDDGSSVRWRRVVTEVYSAPSAIRAARGLEQGAESLVAAVAPVLTGRVLDVAAGDGNVAAVAARHGVEVVACDLVLPQLEAGRSRARQERVAVHWVGADMERLPFMRDVFQCALSNFGIIYSPRPQSAVHELARVVEAGGVIGFTAHAADSYNSRLRTLLDAWSGRRSTGAGPAARSWAVPEIVGEWLAPVATDTVTTHHVMSTRYESLDECWTKLVLGTPHLRRLTSAAGESEAEALRREFEDLVLEHSSVDGQRVVLHHDYIVTTATVATDPGL